MSEAYNPDYLSAAANASYAELVEQLQTAPVSSELPAGTPVRKTVKGHTYWYVQYVEAGKKRQVYLGPESEALVERLVALEATWDEERRRARQTAELVSMLSSTGIHPPDAIAARVLATLARHGIFRVGGVLVGSYAFAAYEPMLGVRWRSGFRTEDVDIAAERHIGVAVDACADLRRALEAADLPFDDIPCLDPRTPSTSFKLRGRAFRVDVLTPERGRTASGPIRISHLNVAAYPLRYLDVLMNEPQPAALVVGSGILVRVPHPAAFAWHKLIVANRRPAFQQAKVRKDLDQAGQLFSVLTADRPGDVIRWFRALAARHDRALTHARRAAAHLPATVRAALSELVELECQER